ncbi:Pathogen-related protein [Morella rubra]|uniref:Pathogen-related protein n=1 Tax=Morella rubra TaxID=262757 RepID=A0A6A1VU41_9ROSI|nr:Pathogen-related protein [Morella rubra]
MSSMLKLWLPLATFDLVHVLCVECPELAPPEINTAQLNLAGRGSEDTQWRHGGPPTFEVVNKLFVEGRAKEWSKGSLEEAVQNALKSWAMELTHKSRFQDFKT